MSIGKASDFRVHDQSFGDAMAKRPIDSSYITLSDDSIADDASIGDVLGTLSITAAYVGTPRWEIIGQSNFTVNSSTGVVTVAHALTAGADSFKVKLRGTTPQINSPTFAIIVDTGGGGGGGYTASAVHFDGATVLGLTDLMAALAAASSTGLFACYLKANTGAAGHMLVHQIGGGGYFDILLGARSVANSVGSDFGDYPDYAMGYSVNSHVSPFPTIWAPLLIAWDMGHLPGSRIYQMYFGDSVATVEVEQNDGTAFDLAYAGSQWCFFGDFFDGEGISNVFEGDAADFQFWAGVTADLSNQAVRRLFVDDAGKPVDPATAAATLGQQTVLLSGNAASFATNQGSGPATSALAGTLTNATTSPSD